jgi:hypothetical protein
MKINEYSKGMRFLTSDQGDYSPNAPDIFVQEKPNYKMPNLEQNFADGGSVTTPKRGLVDEPGSYSGEKTLDIKKYKKLENQNLTRKAIAEKLGMSLSTLERKVKELNEPLDYKGKDVLKDPDLPFLMKDPELVKKMKETKRRQFREKPLGKRLQWIADNGKNYESPEKFRKAYEKHFKHELGSAEDALFHFSAEDKATSRYKKGKLKIVSLGSINGLQNNPEAKGGDTFTFKKGFSEDEIFKASIIQNNPKVQKQFKNLFENITNNVSEYQESGPQGIVKKLKKDGGNLLNDFDFLESYDPEPGAKQAYGGVHSGVTRRSLINLGIPKGQIEAFQSVRQPVLSLKNILTNLKNYPESFGKSYGISSTTAKKLTGQLDNFMKGYGEVSDIVTQIDKELGDKTFNKIFGGVNFEHNLAKQFGRDYKYLPRNYLLKGQFTTKNFNMMKREAFDLPLIRLMKQYEAGKISGDKVQSFIDDFNAKTNNYADFSFNTKKGKLEYTDNKVKYDLSRYANPGVAKQELIENIKLTMSPDFQKGFKGSLESNKQLKLFKSKDAKAINQVLLNFCPRVGKSTGTSVTKCTPQEAADNMKKKLVDLKQGKLPIDEANKVSVNLNKVAKVGARVGMKGALATLGPLGIGGDFFVEGMIVANDYLGGMPGKEAWYRNWLSVFFGGGEEKADALQMERIAGTEPAANKYKKAVEDRKELIELYEKGDEVRAKQLDPFDLTSPGEYNLEDIEKADQAYLDKYEQLKKEAEEGNNINTILKQGSPEQEAFERRAEVENVKRFQIGLDQDPFARGAIERKSNISPALTKKQKTFDRDYANDLTSFYGGVSRYAGGGIAKLAGKRFGRPPESGPEEGLASLMKYDNKY